MPPDPRPLFSRSRVVPVLTIESIDAAVPLARALLAGGLSVIEVTLRTAVALEAVRAIRAEEPSMTVGVGTVVTAADAEKAVAAGAAFLVSPGTPEVLAAALAAAPVPALPGCATVTEAMALAGRGFSALKFFPAEASGGVAWLDAVAAPLPGVVFCPTGGIDVRNAAAYLACRNVVAVGGSWVAPKSLAGQGRFDEIAALAREAARL